MDVNIGRVIRSGLAGWAGMTGLITLGRRSGLTRMDITNIEGSLFAEPNSIQAETIGFFTHIGMSLAIAFGYAVGFQLLGLRPSWKTGVLGGIIHWLIASFVTKLASAKHPKRERLDMPGFGGMALGPRSAIGFLIGHLIYGALLGWQYGQDDAY
jgi:hypothetical protein